MPYKDGNLVYYNYGEKNAPVGTDDGVQEFSKIVDAARDAKKPFCDPYFAADKSALDGIDLTDADGNEMSVKWFRPTEIAKQLFDGAEPVFHGTFNEFAIHQGSCGDCWFLATLADVALQPEAINTLVPADNETVGFDSGAFHFRRGKWVDITVDDRLPCSVDPDDHQSIYSAIFSSPTKVGGFWVSLLEKAYAKLYGGFKNIDGGSCSDAMLDFTGGFVQDYDRDLNDPDIPDLINILKKDKKENCLITVSTVDTVPPGKSAPKDENHPEDVSKDGVVMGHAYSCLGIQDVFLKSDPDKKYATLLKLRNPWGSSTEWTGAFSDGDDAGWALVTKDLRRKAEDARKDGEFWTDYEDFKVYIGTVDTCRWSGHFRANETISKDGFTFFTKYGDFPAKNSGKCEYATAYKGKSGYYAHLKPINPDTKGIVKDGLNYNCGFLVDMIYMHYTKSNTNNHIPEYGYWTLWAPGHLTPADKDFLDNINSDLWDQNMEKGERRVSFHKNMPAGTVFIVPWTKRPLQENNNYYIRIATEGDVMEFSENDWKDAKADSGSGSEDGNAYSDSE